jgi:pyruvate ferredoxin oxidoreductase alpha subunit
MAIDALRADGLPVGLVKVRSFRPFPATEIQGLAKIAGALAVIDRDVVYGIGGALHREVQWALSSDSVCKPVLGYIGGLAGRDISVAEISQIGRDALAAVGKGHVPMGPHWLGLKRDLVGEAS